jgi:hypothetical protein
MKAKIFDVNLHKLPPDTSPAAYLEERINSFFKQHQAIRVISTHMNTLILPQKSVVQGQPADPTVIIFSTLFYE